MAAVALARAATATVPDERMLRFVLDRTAVPYFSNLVWFMSDQSVSLNEHITKGGGYEAVWGTAPDRVATVADVCVNGWRVHTARWCCAGRCHPRHYPSSRIWWRSTSTICCT